MQISTKRNTYKAKIAFFTVIISLSIAIAMIFPGVINAASPAATKAVSSAKSGAISSVKSAISPANSGAISQADPDIVENNDDDEDTRDINRKGMVSAGLYHTVLLNPDGKVYCWGDNSYGQLGIGTIESEDSPALVPELANIVMVRAGAYHTLALSADGNVYAWGRNTFGQIGDGTSIASSSPVLVDNIPPIKEIAAGAFHSLALSIDGSVYAWGNNNDFQVGDVLSENITDETGNILGKRVVTPQIIVEGGVKSIAAGGSHSLYLNENGQVFAWGDNASGQLGDGSVISRGLPELIAGLSSVTKISAGYAHNLAVSEKSAVVGKSTVNYQNLYVWGSDSDGQLGLGNSSGEKTYADRPTRVDINKDSDEKNDRISLIEAGYSNSMITVPEIKKGKRTDSIYIWGNNSYGQLGIGALPSQNSPVILIATSNGWTGSSFLPFQSIAIGGYHSVFLSVKGFVGAAGRANKGQLGNVSVIDCNTPIGVIVPDAISPEWKSLVKLQTAIKGNVVSLKWEEAFDNIRVTGYEVSYIGKDQRLKNRIIEKGLQYNINDFDLDLTQTISVKSIDKAGNRSKNPLEYEYVAAGDAKTAFSASTVSTVSGVTSISAISNASGVSGGSGENAAKVSSSAVNKTAADPLLWAPDLYGTINPLEVPWDVDYIYGAGIITPPVDYSWMIALIITIVIVAFFLFLGIAAFKKKNRGHKLFRDEPKNLASGEPHEKS
ncbi:MAG: RCC1 domain-containing protein [Saccharofermentanales bacterium]